jgi:hypothetical protein
MPIDDRTTSRSYAKPASANYLSEDVLRLRDALEAIDVDISGLLAALAGLAPSAGPVFTGIPSAPTAAPDTNTTQLATTAFVINQAGVATPLADTVNGTAGSSLRYSRQDHRHPIDATRAPLDSPVFTGTPAAPTPPAETNSTRLATTEFVQGQGFVRQTRTIFTSPGLTGGGDLSGNRTLAPELATTTEAQNGSAASTKLMTPGLTALAITAQTASISSAAASAQTAANSAVTTANAAAAQVADLAARPTPTVGLILALG